MKEVIYNLISGSKNCCTLLQLLPRWRLLWSSQPTQKANATVPCTRTAPATWSRGRVCPCTACAPCCSVSMTLCARYHCCVPRTIPTPGDYSLGDVTSVTMSAFMHAMRVCVCLWLTSLCVVRPLAVWRKIDMRVRFPPTSLAMCTLYRVEKFLVSLSFHMNVTFKY